MRTPARPAEPSAAAHQEEAGAAGDHAQPAAAANREQGRPARLAQPAAANREEGRLPGHVQPAADGVDGGPPPISELLHETMDGVGGPGPPTDLDRSIRRWIDRCGPKFLNHISMNAARDEGSADGQSWTRNRDQEFAEDHGTDSADRDKYTNGLRIAWQHSLRS